MNTVSSMASLELGAEASSGKQWTRSAEEVQRGVAFNVRYVGSMEVLTSMRSMAYADRAQVAKECISRVCDASGMKTPSKKQKVEKRISRELGLPNLDHAGEDVALRVSVDRVEIVSLNDNKIISSHELPDISFASGGDADTIDFIAYVGKSSERATSLPGRWCYVIECGTGVSQECVATIGQAFDLRFKQYMKKSTTSPLDSAPEPRTTQQRNSEKTLRNVAPQPLASPPIAIASAASLRTVPVKESADTDYYNDMPGKKAPDSELKSMSVPSFVAPRLPPPVQRHRTEPKPLLLSSNRPESNLIDLNSPGYDKNKQAELIHDFDPVDSAQQAMENRDPFEGQAFDALLPPSLENYSWYHGQISRIEAEIYLQKDGDFLVRATKSQVTPLPHSHQQFALSGMQQGRKHHILLVDHDGVIRARDEEFPSVPALIDSHLSTREPILSGTDEIYLLRGIPRPRPL
ncbi:SHC-transforming protein 1-like [Paramacrobiotus metropolitanus]|uniref:SHC-transforming protein 1-like n=1 Tax=Paramacrobiotus metropolitanus TaxID=2943436 RepID=UPI0024457461|nr:SHC-transforming protein 1-like [Paramacrobiotus metropolitanus]